MDGFSYQRPGSIAEAVAALQEAGAKVALLAGGTDLLLKAKKGRIKPEKVISLTGIEELTGIVEEDGALKIGAGTTLRRIELSETIHRLAPIMIDATANMASIQIRNVATVGGNICNAAPSADTAPPLLALGAEAKIIGPGGERSMPLKEFFVSPSKTALEPGEILSELKITLPQGPAGGGYAKVSRRKAMDLALLGVAVQIEFEADGLTCKKARIGLGVAGPTPRRAIEAEDYLAGKEITEESLQQAGELGADESACRTSLRGDAWYRREMIRVFTRRMGMLALERAKA